MTRFTFNKDNLIKDPAISSMFDKLKSANQINSNINAYVQKKFLDILSNKHFS